MKISVDAQTQQRDNHSHSHSRMHIYIRIHIHSLNINGNTSLVLSKYTASLYNCVFNYKMFSDGQLVSQPGKESCCGLHTRKTRKKNKEKQRKLLQKYLSRQSIRLI